MVIIEKYSAHVKMVNNGYSNLTPTNVEIDWFKQNYV